LARMFSLASYPSLGFESLQFFLIVTAFCDCHHRHAVISICRLVQILR
jgi:hypothetical protein